jgi:hypothetical protein
MLNDAHFEIVAGDPSIWDQETRARLDNGESLTSIQEDQHARGRRSAEVVPTVYGWSVRHGSGLDGFNLMFGYRKGDGHLSYEEALNLARGWQEEDPANREVFVRKPFIRGEPTPN